MPAPYQTNTLTATITGAEFSTGNVPINRGLGNLAFNSNFSEFCTYQTIPVGTTTITLPASKVTQVYVKNNDNANNIVVNYTPSGGSSQVTPTLGPGECFLIWQAAIPVVTGGGITALSITATVPVLVEYFLGG